MQLTRYQILADFGSFGIFWQKMALTMARIFGYNLFHIYLSHID